MAPRFQVLLHSALWTALRAEPPERRRRFARLVERLAARDWSGGTRAKKLRGCARPVFEARQDGGDRVLFTFGSSAVPDDPGRLAPFLQVWDLVPHDDVNRTARGLNPSVEAEFLTWAEVEAETLTEPPARPAARFADLTALEAGGEAGLLEYALPPEDLAEATEEDLAGSVRWYVLPDRLIARDEEWQDLGERGAEELELKLTGAQYSVARAPGPVLLSGSAGSGKTTIAIHRLAAATTGAAAASSLYVTYSRWLLDHARQLFTDLALCRGRQPAVAPRFLTVEELYRTLIMARGGSAPDRVVGFAHFARFLRGEDAKLDAVLAWEEIRSIVKGACLDPKRALLSRAEHEAKGRKRAPLFTAERGRLHDVALAWQAHLEKIGACDEIDLCRLALRALRPEARVDHVVCDEAQDLAEIQVDLLLRLCRGQRFEGLYLAGDPQQVVNPSGFRWAEVRTALRDRLQPLGRPAPALTTLTRNFRSVHGIVELANEVLALARERTGRSEGDDFEEAVVTGAAPVLVQGSEEDLLRVIADFGPRAGIVTGSEADRDRLAKALDTTRVFTVAEAKGLEFDVAVLWGVVSADAGPWRRLLDPAESLREDPACRRALHHLYVAVTRARRHLAIHEPAGAPPLWADARFARRLDVAPPDTLSRLLVRAASLDDWLAEGEWFLERGRHRQAAECFRRAGDSLREAACLAAHHEAVGDDRAAAGLFERLGLPDRAAACAERAGDFAAAARLWAKAGNGERARRARTRNLEAGRDWKAAGEEWESQGDLLQAARCYSNANLRPRQLGCLARADETEGRPADAAPRWEEAGDLVRAAASWRAAGQEREALRCDATAAEAAGRFAAAATAWSALGERQRASRCAAAAAEGAGRFAEAARLHEDLGDLVAAIRSYKRAGLGLEATRCEIQLDIEAGRFAKAAESLEAAGEFTAAAETWTAAADSGQAARRAMPLPIPPAAARKWEKAVAATSLNPPARRVPGLGSRVRTAPATSADSRLDARRRALACGVTAAEADGRFDEAAGLWRTLRQPKQAARCAILALDAAGRHAEAAEQLEALGGLAGAALRWDRAGNTVRSAGCRAPGAVKRKKWAEAAQLFEAAGKPVEAARCLVQHHHARGEHDLALAALEGAGLADDAMEYRFGRSLHDGEYEEALRIATAAGRKDMVRAAEAALKSRRPAKVARPPRTAEAAQDGLFDDQPTPARRSVARPMARAAHLSATDLDAQVLALIRRVRGGTRCEDLTPLLPVSTPATQASLRRLLALGLILKSGRARGTRYFVA